MRLDWICVVLVFAFLPFQAAGAESSEEPSGQRRLYDALGYAMFAGSAGDFLSTQYALSRGAQELNPLQREMGVRVATTVAFPFVANYLSDELRKDGHEKLALWLRIALVGLKSYAIAHNLRVAR
jgi:hypothetical protein